MNNNKSNVIRNVRIPFFLAQISFVVHVLYMFFSMGLSHLDEPDFFIAATSLISLVVLLLAYFSLIRTKLNNLLYENFTLILFVTAFLIYTDIICLMIRDLAYLQILSIIMQTLSLILIFLEINLLCGFIYAWDKAESEHDSVLKQISNAIILIAIIAVLTNAFVGYFFKISEQGEYIKGPYYIVTYLLALSVYVCTVIYTIKATMTVRDKLMLLIISSIPFISSLISYFLDLPRSHLTIFLAVLFIYTVFFVDKVQQVQEKEILLSLREKQLSDSEVNALRAKMNPHFIYNTLSSIYGLSLTRPEAAADMTLKLESYLRDNFGKISINPMIPFFEELEHLKYYIDIEQIRFPNLKVEYDITADYFLVPSLSVQPMVENAIRHGIQKVEDARGTIKISSWEDADGFFILIEDNGVGIREDFLNDGKVHLGLKNTQTRLRLLCGGSLKINALSPHGTRCQIFIPKKP